MMIRIIDYDKVEAIMRELLKKQKRIETDTAA